MSLERIVKGLRVALVFAGIFAFCSAPLAAQKNRGTPSRQARTDLQAPEMRVKPPAVDPELERLLKNWADATAKIQKLQGTHHRWVYDRVFEVEKRAQGMFYYEAPDKGRIDIEGVKIEKGLHSKLIGKSGEPYRIESDTPSRWICNGKEIQIIDDKEKTVDIVAIPQDAQGRNIMDGPLPFLFGMPPEKAKQRFRMKIEENNRKSANVVTLEITPLQKQDAENWRKAMVMLDLNEFLPIAVKLEDPSGNIETSYFFENLEKNKGKNIFARILPIGEDVFEPKLNGYRKHLINPNNMAGPPAQNGVGFQPGTVPRVTNMHARDAADMLKKAGYQVSYEAGKQVKNNDIVYTVYDQTPRPGTPLDKNQTVRITYYELETRETAKPAAGQDDPRATP